MHTIAVHPQNPQKRRLDPAIEAHAEGATLIVPTESGYRLVLPFSTKSIPLGSNTGLDQAFLLCTSISQASSYAHIDNNAHRTLKTHLTDPHTIGQSAFVLPADKIAPKSIKRKNTIAIAFSVHPVVDILIKAQATPLLCLPLSDGFTIYDIEENSSADYFICVGELEQTPIHFNNLT